MKVRKPRVRADMFTAGLFDTEIAPELSRSAAVLIADVVPRSEVRLLLDILGIEVEA